MMLLKAFATPLAKMTGACIGLSPALLEVFRSRTFRGKHLIAGALPETLPVASGIYRCNGLMYDLDLTDQIQRAVYLGVYEQQEREFLRSYVQPGWTCVDIGANIGFYTLLLATLAGPSGHVYAIEASPKNFARLSRNVALNALTQCALSSVAITAKNGAVSFLTSPETNSGWGRIAGTDTGREIISLDGLTFDHFVRTQGIHSVDFLKVDIEGHELSLLEGGQKTLESGVVKRALVEFCGYHMEKRNTTLADFIAAFERLGFRPCRFSMDKVESARRGTYAPQGEILNLLLEHAALSART